MKRKEVLIIASTLCSMVAVVAFYELVIFSFTNQVLPLEYYTHSTILVTSQYINQPANSHTDWTFHLNSTGYVKVSVGAASTPQTYIQVTHDGYDNHIWCGWDSLNGGEGTFPVIPTPTGIDIRVGNTVSFNNTVLVEITYYYQNSPFFR